MLIRALKEITYRENSEEYLQNYLDALPFIDEVYFFVKDISRLVPANKIVFRPTFNTKTADMTYFEIQSRAFLGDDSKTFNKLIKNTKLTLKYEISRDDDIVSFLIRK